MSTAQPLVAGASLEASSPWCTRPLFSSCLAHKQHFRGWAVAVFPADHSWVLPASPGPPSHLHHIDSIHATLPWPCTGLVTVPRQPPAPGVAATASSDFTRGELGTLGLCAQSICGQRAGPCLTCLCGALYEGAHGCRQVCELEKCS